MKLYVFQSGSIRTVRRLIVRDGGETPLVVPVFFFLIVHPKGNVLYDGGQPASAIGDDRRGPPNRPYVSILSAEDLAVNQLGKVGLDPSAITHVVLSHLHEDHAGDLGAFPNAQYVLQRAELDHGANRQMLSPLGLNLRLLEADDPGDLFGDHAVQILPTPGHTPGHQSLLLRPTAGPAVLLTGDSVYTEDQLNDGLPVGVEWSAKVACATLERIRRLRAAGVRIVTGHDSANLAVLPLAPRAV